MLLVAAKDGKRWERKKQYIYICKLCQQQPSVRCAAEYKNNELLFLRACHDDAHMAAKAMATPTASPTTALPPSMPAAASDDLGAGAAVGVDTSVEEASGSGATAGAGVGATLLLWWGLPAAGAGAVTAAAATVTSSFMPAAQWPGTLQMK